MSEPPPNNAPDRDPVSRVRWWPAALIGVLAAVAIGYVRWIREGSHQERNLQSMVIGMIAFILVLVWLAFLSRIRKRLRLLALGGALGLVIALAGLFEIRGVTGDLLPILGFRWKRPLESITTTAPDTGATPSAALHSSESLTNDFPQFMGPHRNATLPAGPKLARDWTARPPTRLWRQPIGAAWSAFAVAGSRAVTQEQRGEEELVVCYELLTGKVLWAHADTARYFTTLAGEGPRTTPSIVGDKVVTLGATGILNCLELTTGKVLWRKDIFAENQSHMGEWGAAGSPLVLRDRVIVNPGGNGARSLVAYRLADGDFVWGGGSDDASYSSPCTATLDGVFQILIFNQHAIYGHDADTGRVLWQHPWPANHPHVAMPVVVASDRVVVSSGYGTGSELLRVHRDDSGKCSVIQIWKTNRLKAKFNNPVVRDGHLYGLDDGILACVEVGTGELKWKDGRYGHGQFILVGDLLLITVENGEVALVDPLPTERRELSRFRAVNGKTWNPPALAGDLLLVRNDQEAACYRLPVEH